MAFERELVSLDWFWLILVIASMVFLGLLFYRLGKRSEADFFLAGRGLPWWLPASSVYATHTGTDTPMWFSGVIYRSGLAGIWYGFFTVWVAISAFFSTKLFRRSPVYTQGEWQTIRYSGLNGELTRGYLSGWRVFMDIWTVGWMNAAIYKICDYLWGISYTEAFLIFTITVAIYVMLSGYWGVIIADFQQSILVLSAMVIVSIFGIMETGGPSEIVSYLEAEGEGWRLNPFSFTVFGKGKGIPLAWFLTMIFAATLAGLGMGSHTDWYTEAQRIQSARTLKDSSYSMWSGSIMIILRNSLWAVAILAFFVLTLKNGGLLTDEGEYEMAWYRLGFDLLPVGLLGFFIGTIVAIHFSTVSTHLNLGSSYFTRDLYQHYVNPEAPEKKLVWVGRLGIVVVLIGSFFMGYMMKEDITAWLIFAMWIGMAGTWIPCILQVVWWRFNAKGWLAAWIANLGLAWMIVWILPDLGVMPELPEHMQFWTLLAISAAIYLPVTLLTKPEPMDHLVKFYMMCRPYGFWEPVKREAERRGLLGGEK